jgi:hypothetical protein
MFIDRCNRLLLEPPVSIVCDELDNRRINDGAIRLCEFLGRYADPTGVIFSMVSLGKVVRYAKIRDRN